MAICGKFRGTVIDNQDPEGIGRLKVSVPDVQGGIEGFAMPCLPFAGAGVGFFACPPIGASVWVEFEAGDVNSPIWSGCFWAPGEAPTESNDPDKKVLILPGVSLTLDDGVGGGEISLKLGAPASGADVEVRIDARGVLLTHQNAKIRIEGNRVSINDGALEVI
jgi:hypothetical protein